MKVSELTMNELRGVSALYMNTVLKGTKKQQLTDAFSAARAVTGWKLQEFYQLLDAENHKYYQKAGTSTTTRDLPGDGKIVPNPS